MQSGNQTVFMIIWTFFYASLFVAAFVFIRLFLKNRRRKAKQSERLNAFKDKYAKLTPELIDECEDENLTGAIVLECQKKEDEDEDYYTHLNEVEQTVYGIYNINSCLSSSIGLRSFFITPSMEPFVKDLDVIFNRVKAPEFISLLRAAQHLNDVMEGVAEDDENDTGEYAKYNFSDFTSAYKSMIAGTNFEKKVIAYIRENKDQFKGE